MNMKTMALAIGLAGVLLVAGLAAMFSSTQLSDIMEKNKGDSNSSNTDQGNSSGKDNAASDNGGSGANDVISAPTVPSEPIPDNPTPQPVETTKGEPSLWMEYTTSWSGDSIQYGMPHPSANQFTVEVNEYGEDQPEGPVKITNFIHITDVSPRSGASGNPEGTVEIRTYNPDSAVSRLVNLYDDGKGGCYGILVDTFATWDYTWTYEHGKSVKFSQTFSVNITKLGTHTIDVYAIHDHGDGSYNVVSNHLTRSFTTQAQSVVSTGISDHLGNSLNTWYNMYQTIDFQVTAELGQYESNIHGALPYAYSNDVKIKLFVQGSGFTLKMGGITMTGISTTYTIYGTAYEGTMFELGDWSADSLSGAGYDMSITFSDGMSHNMLVVVTDVPSGEVVGFTSTWFYKRT